MLLQQRALHKYHSGGLWTNACCSHPAPGEDTMGAAHRRLQEELGFDTALEKIFDFVYREEVGQGLIENEFDHVFVGYYADEIAFNPEEVMAIDFFPVGVIRQAIRENPGQYTTWFRLAFPKIEAWWNQTGKVG
jgi:Isopentenyldiphosphate isomerase